MCSASRFGLVFNEFILVDNERVNWRLLQPSVRTAAALTLRALWCGRFSGPRRGKAALGVASGALQRHPASSAGPAKDPQQATGRAAGLGVGWLDTRHQARGQRRPLSQQASRPSAIATVSLCRRPVRSSSPAVLPLLSRARLGCCPRDSVLVHRGASWMRRHALSSRARPGSCTPSVRVTLSCTLHLCHTIV